MNTSPFPPPPPQLPFSVQSFSGQAGGSDSSGGGGALASTSGPAPPRPPALAQARRVLAAAAVGRTGCSFRGGNISASCVQTLPRGSGSGSTSGGFNERQGVGMRIGRGEYGSAVVDVMGGGMETLTLPKLVLQGSCLEEVGARAEAYAVLRRLEHL